MERLFWDYDYCCKGFICSSRYLKLGQTSFIPQYCFFSTLIVHFLALLSGKEKERMTNVGKNLHIDQSKACLHRLRFDSIQKTCVCIV